MDHILDSIENESDEEAETLTPAEVLQELEEAWLNEKHAPEILESKADVVDCLMEQVSEMEENIQRAKKGSTSISIHKMELDRVRFVLSSYLRTRLHKIEQFYAHVLEEDATLEDSKLSPQELAYAREYKDNMENQLKLVALQHMPQNLQSLDPKLTTIKPPLDSYVFLRVKENTEGVMVEEETAESREEIIDLEKGDQHIVRYRPISSLVSAGAVALI